MPSDKRHEIVLFHNGQEIGRGEVDDFDALFLMMEREAERLGVDLIEIGVCNAKELAESAE